MNQLEVVIGMDIGGTNTAFGLVDKVGKYLYSDTVSTQSHQAAELLIERVFLAIKQWIKQSNRKITVKGVGVGAPNGNYYTGCIENPPNLGWTKVDLKQLVAKHTDVRVCVTNDANAAALGEMEFGAAKNMKNFIEITLGTGLGSGLIVDGELVYGQDGHAGEIGHTIAVPAGRLCNCGRNGCLETYASAEGLRTTVKELLAENSNSSAMRNIPFEKLTAKMVSEAAESGDAIALEAFQFTADILGRAMADSVAYLSPQAIIFFGGLTQAGDLLFKPLKKSFENALLSTYKGKVQLLRSGLKASEAAVLGAAALIWHELMSKT